MASPNVKEQVLGVTVRRTLRQATISSCPNAAKRHRYRFSDIEKPQFIEQGIVARIRAADRFVPLTTQITVVAFN